MALHAQTRQLAEYGGIGTQRVVGSCLDRCIPDNPTLVDEAAAWETSRNKKPVKADWHFTSADARARLKRLYSIRAGQQKPISPSYHRFRTPCRFANKPDQVPLPIPTPTMAVPKRLVSRHFNSLTGAWVIADLIRRRLAASEQEQARKENRSMQHQQTSRWSGQIEQIIF
jgi:hypothetical protein